MNPLANARRATLRAERARRERDDAIREAAATHSLAEVAAATGLSKARVQQIASKVPADRR